MAYQALYRKWRPKTFSDVKGQDHIVAAIKNQVISGRMSHAYLFCGTRGTGKTSVAKILAKAVNCENPQNGEPCGCCRSCRSVDEGNSMNVMEIDAASNNGVDYIREIREEVQYAPAEGNYKVYIIDEAHMLTNSAWNALLKTLEEPPEYVIFIFATTEANKILATVLSRVQRYDFRRIESSVIAERLGTIAAAEHMSIEDDALRFIAVKGEGSHRDAITLLDKCAAACFGETITYEKVLNVLGVSNNEKCSLIYRSVIAGDVSAAIRCCHECFESGIDAPNFVTDLIHYLRALMLLQATGGNEDVLEMTKESIEYLKADCSLADVSVVMRYLKILSETYGQLRSTAQKITLIEMMLVRMARPEADNDTQALLQRIDRLEREVADLRKNGITASGDQVNMTDEASPYPDQDYYMEMYASPEAYYGEEPEDTRNDAPLSPYVDDSLFTDISSDQPYDKSDAGCEITDNDRKSSISDSEIMSRWSDIVRGVGGAASLYLGDARIIITSETSAILAFASEMSYEFGSDERNLQIIREEIEKIFGIKLELTPKVDDGKLPKPLRHKKQSQPSDTEKGICGESKSEKHDPVSTPGKKLDHDSLQNLFGMTVDSE